MARSGASSHWLHTTASIADPVLGGTNNPFLNAYSYHCWVRSSVVPNQGSTRIAMAANGDNTGSANNPYSGLFWDHTSGSFYKAAIQRQSTGTFNAAQLTSSPAANTWHSFGGTFNGTLENAWLNGVNEGAQATNISENKKVWPSILGGRLSDGSLDGQFSNGEVAEVAFWNVVLGTDDFNALFKGFRPTLIRPQNLISYLPLVRITQDLKGYDWTEVNSPTVTDHPRMIG